MDDRMDDRQEPEVIPFEPAAKESDHSDVDQLDKAGQTILRMLGRAAVVVEENSRQALDTAQKLSHQLRGAEGRIAELEQIPLDFRHSLRA